jgi:acyl-CoA synthetase (AMP-forming)/AMP-acid ligase II/acyl carrier protein
VAVEHRAVVRLVRGAGYVAFGPGEAVLQAAPASFDASTLEIWGALLNGGRVVPLAAAAPSLAEIGGAVARHGVTTMWLTAGLFQLMARERLDDLAGVRQLLAGGDVLPPDAVRAVRERFPAMRLVNGYGPTENTTFTCCHTVGAEWDGGPVPIGTPISGTRAYVLDAALRPVPLGVAGELYAGGLGVARGYLHRPALTAGRFLPDPFSATPGARMYRTGDRVRWVEEVRKYGSTEVRQGYGADEASSGAGPIVLSYSRTFVLHFLGRLDTQVKIRGFRIEPGEVEAALLAHPRVSACAVAARPDPAGGRRLVAWVAGGADAGELREHLRASLPEHMVPAAFVMVEALPLTPNGKVDRSALPEPDAAATSDRLHAPPETAAEEALAAIWAEVLGVERVGRGDSFFELGGHSLLVMRLLNHLHAELGVELSIRTVFSHHTLAAMASEVERTLYAELAALPDDEVERLAGLTATGGPR